MPQPNKGDRKLFSTRLPRPLAERVAEEAAARNSSYSDLLAAILAERYDLPALSPMPLDARDMLPVRMTG